jgi:hypothetical protein
MATNHSARIRRTNVAASRMTYATADRADRLRRSLKRLGFDLVATERRGRFHITREGSKVDEASLDFAGVEAWIRERAKG